MNEEVRKQILAIRKTGITNMFDIPKVTELADDFGFDELISFLKNDRRQYVQFILSGRVTDD